MNAATPALQGKAEVFVNFTHQVNNVAEQIVMDALYRTKANEGVYKILLSLWCDVIGAYDYCEEDVEEEACVTSKALTLKEQKDLLREWRAEDDAWAE